MSRIAVRRAAVRALLAMVLGAVLCHPPRGRSADPGLTGWMSKLDPEIKLSQISIPGSHDSGARHDPWYGYGTTRCQRLCIRQQLDIGVRFLDIRLYLGDNELKVCHGCVDQRLPFNSVLDQCQDFLSAHGSECIILSLQNYEDTKLEKPIRKYMDENPAWWLPATQVPTLAQAKGKLVLLRRFPVPSGKPLGIDATCWPEDANFCTNCGGVHLRIQDNFHVSCTSRKWAAIKSLYQEAQPGDPDVLYLNFTSGGWYFLGLVPYIHPVACRIDPRIKQYFTSQPKGAALIHAITVMDYVNKRLCAAVIQENWRDQTRH